MNLTDEIAHSLCIESFLATGLSSPNPPVAALAIDDATGRILSSSHTEPTGSIHAERSLYQKLDALFLQGFPQPKSHSLFVSLEPCTHQGRTEPCRDLILVKKPSRLIVGFLDPNPIISENRDDGLYSKVGIHLKFDSNIESLTRSFLTGFFTRIKENRPKIIIKSSISSEGYFAPIPMSRLPISSPESTPSLQMLRGKVDAILVGPKTVEIDIPSLEFRPVRLELEDGKSYIEANRYNKLTESYEDISANLPTQNSEYNFWKYLVASSQNQTIVSSHIEREEEYQPVRVFVLGKEESIPAEFIELQDTIQNSRKLSRIVFYFLQDYSSYSESFKKRITSIPRITICYNSEQNWAIDILQELALLGVNLLLVEGGNCIYKNFLPVFGMEDEILIIQNTKLHLDNGIRPCFIDEIQSNDWKLGWDTQLGSDIWKVYKKR